MTKKKPTVNIGKYASSNSGDPLQIFLCAKDEFLSHFGPNVYALGDISDYTEYFWYDTPTYFCYDQVEPTGEELDFDWDYRCDITSIFRGELYTLINTQKGESMVVYTSRKRF